MEDRYLFKAKSAFNDTWHIGLLATREGKWYISNKAGSPFAYEIDEETICQCIGLKDKNGTLIWENDIVFLSDEINGFKWQAVVRYGNPNGLYNWGWQLVPMGVDSVNTDILLWIEMDGASAVVVGNVFDKPEIGLCPAQMKLLFEKGLEGVIQDEKI